MSPTKTFERIALCLSGGGFRAAAFHLGTLDMLDELGLLDSVKVMSTASGGTIVAAAYAVSKVEMQNFDFNVFRKDFIGFLKEVNVVQEALELAIAALKKDPGLDVSLIHFAAEVYEQKLFGGKEKKLDTLLKKVGKPFDDLIFNATELYLGNSFRFRAGKPGKIIGSQKFNVNKSVAEEILMGDVVASSSCFPGVFDPFVFPDDFHLDVSMTKSKLRSGFKPNSDKEISLPIMDGGIFDNQGVYGILLSQDKSGVSANEQKKSESKKPEENTGQDEITVDVDDLDLIIIGDSNPLNTDLFPAPVPRWKTSGIEKQLPGFFHGLAGLPLSQSAEDLANIGLTATFIVFAASITCLAFLGLFISQTYQVVLQNLPLSVFAFVFPAIFISVIAVFCFVVSGYLVRFKQTVARAEVFIDKEDHFKMKHYPPFSVWGLIKRTNTPGVIKLLETRIKSTLCLTTDVFLKRIRDLGVKVIKKDKKLGPLVAFNYITDLNYYNNVIKRNETDLDVRPTKEMIDVTVNAGKCQTNLWCNSTKELEDIILAGQISICYSLLRYFWDSWNSLNIITIKENKERARRNCNEPQEPLPLKPNSPGYEYQNLYDAVKEKWSELKNGKRASYQRLP